MPDSSQSDASPYRISKLSRASCRETFPELPENDGIVPGRADLSPRLSLLLTFVVAPLLATTRADDAIPRKDKPGPPKGYLCYQATTPVVVDGKLDDAAWAARPGPTTSSTSRGTSGPRPRFRTRAKMLWDDRYFYIAAELEEPHVWATLTKHDSVIFQDNDFEVFIDPDGDNHDYAEFEINALNTELGPVAREALPRRRPGPQRAGRSPG